MELDWLTSDPNPLAAHYSRFRVHERLLLTGHSHQAWPDVGFEGQQRAWLDAAELVDRKWDRAFEKADRVRAGWKRLLDDDDGDVTLAPNTHDVVLRFLSALPLRERPRVVTTDGEFHTIRRQLDRFAEEGLEVVRVPSAPADGIADALAEAADDRTAAVMVSSVLFRNAHIVPGLGRVMAACRRVGAQLLIDTYHSLGVVPFSVRDMGLSDAFVVGGGYKYCQLGEGNCFLRVPPGCTLRPAVTGWFSEFATLAEVKGHERVAYGEGPARFAGSTYDPTSHYRAAEVFDFFGREGLTPPTLRAVSQHQIGVLAEAFDALDLDPSVVSRDRSLPLEGIGGFLALESDHAGELSSALGAAGVLTDFRANLLRFGPAPYHSDRQLRDAMAALDEGVRTLE